MNMLIYDENSVLRIRKPNGLEFSFENTDRPDLGFEFDVLIYDDIEVKILKWEDGKSFDQQTKDPLTETDKDSIETYIENSEPPMGSNLNQQYSQQLVDICRSNTEDEAQRYDFDNFTECVYAGREGSKHPFRSNARRVLEYSDALYCVYYQVADEIRQTREDTLKPFEEYFALLPSPMQFPDSDNRVR